MSEGDCSIENAAPNGVIQLYLGLLGKPLADSTFRELDRTTQAILVAGEIIARELGHLAEVVDRKH